MYTFNEDYRLMAGQFRKHAGSLLRRHGAALMMLTGATGAAGSALSAESRTQEENARDHCEICAPDLDAPVVQLSTAYLDSLARGWASYNAKQIDRIDSLLRSGFYGPPEDEASIRRAHMMARVSTVNAYRDMVRLAGDPSRVYEMNEETLRPLYQRYSDVNVFIGVPLEHLRMGRGKICVRYRLSEDAEGISWHGGKRFAWRVEDDKIDGRKQRVLNVHFPTGSEGEVEFIFAGHHTLEVSHGRSDGPPAPFEWFIVRNIEGVWVRKWGMHRPTAYMFWVSAPQDEPLFPRSEDGRPVLSNVSDGDARAHWGASEGPLVGLRLYIPQLRLKMRCLPDVGVEDLRTVELAMPILELDYIRNHAPDWLDVNKYLGFDGWKGAGPLPPEIRQWFPDR